LNKYYLCFCLVLSLAVVPACPDNGDELPECAVGQTLVFEESGWACKDLDSLPVCAAGQVIVSDGTGWTCQDVETLPPCAAGEVIVWDGTVWTCRDAEELPACAAAEMVVWNGTAWTCQAFQPLPSCTEGQQLYWEGTQFVCKGGCGDGQINGDEECDGSDFPPWGESCSDYGFSMGTLDCNNDCTVSTGLCMFN
jgi:hypothetical protein